MKKLISIVCLVTVMGLFPSASIFAEKSEEMQIKNFTAKCEIEAKEEGVMSDEKKEYVEQCVADLMSSETERDAEPEKSESDTERKTE